MKVKNLFSSRKNKKKKASQQVTSSNDGNSSDKLILPPDPQNDSAAAEKENERVHSAALKASVTSSTADDNKVVLRTRADKGSLKSVDHELNKARTSSTSSTSSAKTKSSRRPWSFIEQLRRQDSKDSTPSTSGRSSQVIEDVTAQEACGNTPTLPDRSVLRTKLSAPARAGACTLPRSMTAEEAAAQGASGHSYSSRNTLDSRRGGASEEHSRRPRTMDFRFFHFFKRSTSGDSSPSSAAESPSPADSQPSSNRSSQRGKAKSKKKTSKKKRDQALQPKEPVSLKELRSRSLSDGCETSSTITYDDTKRPSAGFILDSPKRLNSVSECTEPPLKVTEDKRVPENGEPAFYLGDDSEYQDVPDSRPSSTKTLTSRDSPRCRGSETYSARTSCDSANMSESHILIRSSSESTESESSRRSSSLCERRDSPLPEDSMTSFASSTSSGGGGARSKELRPCNSATQFTRAYTQKLQRALSNEMANTHEPTLSAQARCSQSVTNLSSGSKLSVPIPRSSSDAEKSNSERRIPQPSPHQQKQDQNRLARTDSGGVQVDMVAPPSPVLRAIGYPGVVLRRNKHKRSKQRPNSAYADQRTQHVLSLNMEDLPTYSRIRNEMVRSNVFPSYEDILAVREVQPGSNRASGASSSSGIQFASTASGRARRKGQRASAGFSAAASVDDLDSLSSSYGSKQSLSDIPRMDEDEILNAFLARAHASTHTSSGLLRQEPSSKRVKTIRKSVVSLANLISPGKPSRSSKIQRSSSFKESGSASSSNTAAVASFKPYRPPSNTPNKKKDHRRSKLWCETFDHTGLNERQIKWQEAIFELYQGERDLVEDLTMAKQTYRDSMVTLKMLSDEEVTLIFGKLGCLLPLHEELLEKLEQARGEDGRTLSIGYIFVEWFPRISTAYRDYCANQADAKYALDAAVERDARVRDFLQRCLESPFSRKLDLWSYLDLPRTRLVKYPLLLSNVLKRTPVELIEEKGNLNKVMDIIGEIIEKVDETTGEQQCSYIRSKLEYLDDKQRSAFVDNSRLMLCSGQLKNNRGTKMHVFLFEEALVLTRQATRSNKISYQVYRHPIPMRSLVVESSEGEKLSGSFRGGILSSEKVKHSFRVRSEELNVTYTLQASEEHDRKQWINAIQDALAKYRSKHPDSDMPPPQENHSQVSRRRATYDPTHAANNKKQAARAVLRSSSDKSNRSVVSSSDKSLQEESQEDDASTTSEDVSHSWRRMRSQTVNPSILSSTQSSLSRKSSTSSAKSDKSSKEKKSKRKTGAEAVSEGIQERLQRLQAAEDGPPSPLIDSSRRSSSRRGSLSTSDKAAKPAGASEIREKRTNLPRRTQSLTSSPQIIRAVVSRFGNKRFSHSKSSAANGALPPSASKPPIGPTASPFAIRRSPSLQVGSIHEARSTPNLMSLRSSWRASKQAVNTRKSNNGEATGALRNDIIGGSEIDLRNAARAGFEAKCQRKTRSQNSSRATSETEMETQESDSGKSDSGGEAADDAQTENHVESCQVASRPTIAITCATPVATAARSAPETEPEDQVEAEEKSQEFNKADVSTVMSPDLITITTVEPDDVSNSDDVMSDGMLRSTSEIMADYVDTTASVTLPAQSSEVDLMSFSSGGQDETEAPTDDEMEGQEEAPAAVTEDPGQDAAGVVSTAMEITQNVVAEEETMDVAPTETKNEDDQAETSQEDVEVTPPAVEDSDDMDHCDHQTELTEDCTEDVAKADDVACDDVIAANEEEKHVKEEESEKDCIEMFETVSGDSPREDAECDAAASEVEDVVQLEKDCAESTGIEGGDSLPQENDCTESPDNTSEESPQQDASLCEATSELEEVALCPSQEEEPMTVVTEDDHNVENEEVQQDAPVDQEEDSHMTVDDKPSLQEETSPEATSSDIDNNNAHPDTDNAQYHRKLDNERPAGSCGLGFSEGLIVLENSSEHQNSMMSQHILNNNLQTSV